MLQQLVEGACRGDAEAIRAMVEQFEGPGRRLAVALLGDAHLAEDAVQEALVEAVSKLGALRDAQALPAWFRQIVRTQCNRITRRRSERGPTLPQCESTQPSPCDRVQMDELRQRVRDALTELSAPNRRAAELFYLEGFSLSEVADALNVPVGTVKRRLYDARQCLRNILVGSPATMGAMSHADRTDRATRLVDE